MQSPCIKQCALNKNNICKGCGRTVEQIMNWRDLTNQQRDDIMNNLELKVRLENLESTMDNIVESLETTIQECESAQEEQWASGAVNTVDICHFGKMFLAETLLENIRKWERGED